jgi:hypothetical protein
MAKTAWEVAAKVLILGVILAWLPALALADGEVPCSQGTWVSEPTFANKIFDGTLSATCVLSGGQNIGIAALEQNFLASAKQVTQVISGPASENYEQLNSTAFVVENKSDALDLFETEHVASDGQTRVIFSTVSTRNASGGTAAIIKALDVKLDIVRADNSSNYQLTMTVHVQLTEPWYAKGTFLPIAKSQSEKQFTAQSGIRVPELQKLL